MPLRSICVFAGSSIGSSPVYARAARELARTLVERDITVVYGGGSIGLMNELANGALAAGGRVIGVIPRHLHEREVGHDGITELHIVGTMHERKALMAELSDAFIALPGGLGTLDELIEITTWSQLGLHAKPIGLLDVDGYWQPLLALLDHACEEGFVRRGHLERLLRARDPAPLLDALEAALALDAAA